MSAMARTGFDGAGLASGTTECAAVEPAHVTDYLPAVWPGRAAHRRPNGGKQFRYLKEMPMLDERGMICGRSFWIGPDLERDGDWIFPLDDGHQAEIAAALEKIQGRPSFGFSRDDFPLFRTADLLARVSEELENGYGCARVSGLAVERYSGDELRRIFWGLGLYMGSAVYQNRHGEIMTEVLDRTRDPRYKAVAGPGKVVSSRAKSLSNGELRFHTDGSDVIALLCVRPAMRGGETKLASIATIHNEMRRRRPDLLEHLFRDYTRVWPSRADRAGDIPTFDLPVLGLRDGKITSQYTRTAVEQAQEMDGIALLSDDQNTALDLHAEIAETTCLRAPFMVGDIQFVNNHAVYHSRTAFDDSSADIRGGRLMLRLWFSMPNSRALPEGFESYWGSIEPGALRGGVPQRDGRRAPAPAELARLVA
jgi:TfdA family taurine catabolism dioxygenase TauD